MKALASALFLDIFSTGQFTVRVKVVRGVPRLFIFQKMGEVMRGLSVPLNEVDPSVVAMILSTPGVEIDPESRRYLEVYADGEV